MNRLLPHKPEAGFPVKVYVAVVEAEERNFVVAVVVLIFICCCCSSTYSSSAANLLCDPGTYEHIAFVSCPSCSSIGYVARTQFHWERKGENESQDVSSAIRRGKHF